MRSLVVDDEYSSRMMLKRLLEGYGRCSVATDGVSALAEHATASSQGAPFDLVCLDVRMPGMSGLDVLEQIRLRESGEAKKARVLIVSSLSDRETVFHAVQRRCDGFLLKPVALASLEEKLQHLGLISAG